MYLHISVINHLQGSADLHHVGLLHHRDPEVAGLHELLQEGPVVLVLTPCKQKEAPAYPWAFLQDDHSTFISSHDSNSDSAYFRVQL